MVIEKLQDKFTKYEIARILGARSLQLAMDAPVLLKLNPDEERDLNYDTLKIAEKELEAGVLPITVKRPLPKKSNKAIKKLSSEEIKERLEKQAKIEKKVEKETEKDIIDYEEKEEKEIIEDGEIMELAQPDDEIIEEDEDSSEDELI